VVPWNVDVNEKRFDAVRTPQRRLGVVRGSGSRHGGWLVGVMVNMNNLIVHRIFQFFFYAPIYTLSSIKTLFLN